MKTCSKCKIEKPETEFRTRKDRPCGLRSQCRACDLAYDKSDAGKLSAKKYRQSENGKQYSLRRIKQYQKTAQGKITRNKYRVSLKGRLSHTKSHIIRRDLSYGLDTKLSLCDISIIYDRFKHECFKCRSKENLQIDHRYPLSKGFGLSISNAVLLCQSCNSSKHDRMPEEFYSQDKLDELIKLLVE